MKKLFSILSVLLLSSGSVFANGSVSSVEAIERDLLLNFDNVEMARRPNVRRCIRRCRQRYQAQTRRVRRVFNQMKRRCQRLTSLVARRRCLRRARTNYRQGLRRAKRQYKMCVRRCRRLR